MSDYAQILREAALDSTADKPVEEKARAMNLIETIIEWNVAHPGYRLCRINDDVIVARSNPLGWLHRDGTFKNRSNNEHFDEWCAVLDGCLFSIEEATFRCELSTNPREALAAFYRATGGEYVGGCEECGGDGLQWQPRPAGARSKVAGVTCLTCHGTGGPPSAETLGVVADWMDEHGMTMESEVLRTVTQGETK